MNFTILLILILLVMLCMHNQQHIELLKIDRKSVDTVYHKMKTGDLILVTDKHHDIKKLLLIYHDIEDNNIKYITRKHNGYLQKNPIDTLFTLPQYLHKQLIWIPLTSPLKPRQLKAINESLKSFYPNTVPVNAVIRQKGKHDFVKCGNYLIKLFHDINVVKLLKPTCYDDPINCIQQKYKNSVYLPLGEYYNIKKLIYLT